MIDTTRLCLSLMRVRLLGSEPGRGSHPACPRLTGARTGKACWGRGSLGATSCLAEHSVRSREEQVKALECQARDGVGTTGPEAPGRELRWPQAHPPMPGTPFSQPGVPPPPRHWEARPVESCLGAAHLSAGSPPEPLRPPHLQWFCGNCRRGLPIRTPVEGWKPTSAPPLKLTWGGGPEQ